MSARDPMAWRAELDPAERKELTSELSCALLGYWHGDPTDDVLASAAKMLTEWQELAAVPDRIRPGDLVSLRDFEGGGETAAPGSECDDCGKLPAACGHCPKCDVCLDCGQCSIGNGCKCSCMTGGAP